MATLYAGGGLFDGEKVVDGQGVLEEAGRIKRVAPAGEFTGFAGEKVDTSGGTLIPGLIDCHVHSLSGAEGNPGAAQDRLTAAQLAVRGMELMRATLEGGITAVRDCGGKDYIEFAVRDAYNSGRFLGPTMRCAGRMICMTGGHGNRTGRVADGADEVVKAVREQMKAGISEGHRFGKCCASHAQGALGILNAVRGGIDSIEHGIFMTDECIKEMKERGVWLVPTLAAVKNILA